MSDDELVKFMKQKKLKPDYEKLEREYVLPMNITEVWDTFFNDEAPYSFDNALADLGDKFKEIGSFWKYYSGQEKAPLLTIFIGGNHEASNFLQELPYGG